MVKHCLKSARIRSFSGSYFPAFGMNTERSKYGENTEYLSVFSSNAGKHGPEKLQILTVNHAIEF